ncbi:molybdate transport system substrate-binding protein [Anaerospora hongkongensis]|uniref:Molybdate transport system substrate-binding protein n=1 Tax=Anaerospora hongkongensis TaxID=244830 RepID=A0A4V2Q8G2_9FIRM|nr:substrate-binding domain-containing protein [Anaerospora hongkongensis]TCL36419.1 molybdate transport system substrate-binding protein [Anaerospora hongkongensis]
MGDKKEGISRRSFLNAGIAAFATAAAVPGLLQAARFQAGSLQVWSCGGLAEAFGQANSLYEQRNGIKINYTGAFAGALGKSLIGGAVTEVFAGRVLQLAKTLRSDNKMLYFRPLCFTEYVLVTPLGNPAGIQSVQDLAKPGVKVILPLGASPPGGDAVMGILKKAGIDQAVLKNMIEKESCVIKMMPAIINGEGAASIVERRLTRQAAFAGQVEVLPIPEALFPPGPLTFTIGVMQYAKDRALADDYVNFICSVEGQAIFERHGFIPASSDKGQTLVEKLGVKDG